MTGHALHHAEEQGGPTAVRAGGLRRLKQLVEQLQRSVSTLEARVSKLESVIHCLSAPLATNPACPGGNAALQLLAKLTEREREILIAFARQPNDRQVAEQLGSKRQTISNRLAVIQHKLRVSSRTELLRLIYREMPMLAEGESPDA
jgi:DNA-binding NarL/FixJ family response regulator